jgi:Domain of unknown function (DUF4389)
VAISPTYPVDIQLDAPLQIARWRVIVNPILAIPHEILASALLGVAEILAFIGWFAVLFTGKLPDFVVNFSIMSLRYSWRAQSYQYFMREPYPPFDFEMTVDDDGLDPPTRLIARAETENRNRLTVFFRGLLVIPQFVALFFVAIAASIASIIGWFAVLITGAWPQGLRDFLVGFQRWSMRVLAYSLLLTDEYPPFSTT